jgi:hypothetical protein
MEAVRGGELPGNFSPPGTVFLSRLLGRNWKGRALPLPLGWRRCRPVRYRKNTFIMRFGGNCGATVSVDRQDTTGATTDWHLVTVRRCIDFYNEASRNKYMTKICRKRSHSLQTNPIYTWKTLVRRLIRDGSIKSFLLSIQDKYKVVRCAAIYIR